MGEGQGQKAINNFIRDREVPATGGLPAQLFWFYVLTTAESRVKIIFNAFRPNGISHCDQLVQSISVLRDVEWYFSFLF